MTSEFVLSEHIQYKDLDDFNCEFIDVKKIKKFIRLFKLEIRKHDKLTPYTKLTLVELIDKLAGEKLIWE